MTENKPSDEEILNMAKNEIISCGDYSELIIIRKNGERIKVLIDSEDVKRISHIHWGLGTDNRRKTSNKYAYGVFNKERFSLHRLILFPKKIRGYEVDHINRNTLDNRKINLQYIPRRINARNHRLLATNSSGVNGVSKRGRTWVAAIKANQKQFSIGGLKSFEEAVDARKKLEEEHWGEKHE